MLGGRSPSWHRGRVVQWLCYSVLALAGLAAVAIALYALSHHVATGNSDGATVVLEGQAMANGHLFLGGWSLSLDSFWSVDVPFYAVAVGIDGLSATLMNVVPAVIAALVTTVAAYLATDRQRFAAASSGAVATVAVLTLPSRALALFFLQGPLHVATLLWCLLAFIAICPNRFGWRFAVTVVLLVLGMLGDLQTLLLGVAPLVFAGIVCIRLERQSRAGTPLLWAGLGSVLVAFVVREVLKAIGSFRVPRANTFASFHQLFRNLAHLPIDLLGLLGVLRGPFGSTGISPVLEVAHLLEGIVVIGGPILVIVRLVRMLLVSRGGGIEVSDGDRTDLMLLGCFLASLATFVVLPIITSDAYARYLVPAVVSGAILGGRELSRLVAGAPGDRRAVLVIVDLILVAVLGASYAGELGGPSPGQPATILASALRSHGLRDGVGDYWSASVVTVASHGEVVVRPVIAGAADHLVRYEKQSAASWYGPRERFNFLVFNAGAVWNGVDATAAVHTFGHPEAIYRVGTYRIYVWPRPFTISTNGSTGP